MDVTIYGAGLISEGCWSAFSQKKLSVKVLKSLKKEPKFYTCRSPFRNDPIVGSRKKYGLSNFYHGVTPTNVLSDRSNKTALSHLFELTTMEFPKNHNFVPRSVPRPTLKTELVSNVEFSEFSILAMSVYGNLKELIIKGFSKEFMINDDIVTAIGELDFEVGLHYFGDKIKVKSGVLFPYKLHDDVQISLRPIFEEYAEIDLVSAAKNFNELNFKNFQEKICTAAYLRFGLKLKKVKRWKVFLQINVQNAYILTENSFTENSTLHTMIQKKIKLTKEFLRERIPEMTYDADFKLINGIHLSYDRQQLLNVPQNIFVADTSLNPFKGLHPSISSYCEAYKFCHRINRLEQ